jgi:hypothetical protein
MLDYWHLIFLAHLIPLGITQIKINEQDPDFSETVTGLLEI